MSESVLAPSLASDGIQREIPIRFWRAGRIHEIANVSPNLTLLDYIRSPNGLDARGTKEGCAEGDCGACAVVLAELDSDGNSLQFRAVNSCIRFAHQIDGCGLWTVEDLAAPITVGNHLPTTLHPVQQAMLDAHGSQCGFCTPGFVMSLFALYQSTHSPQLTRDEALAALSGNLCRCTGYRPILDAAVNMMQLPRVEQAEVEIKAVLKHMAKVRQGELVPALADRSSQAVFRPPDCASLLALRLKYPQAQLIAGATDAGLWVNKQGRRFEQVIDISAAQDLKTIAWGKEVLELGAAVRLQDAFQAIASARPQIAAFAHRFAGLLVRQSGTLGGNVANGSPIGDSMPLLISLEARIRLASQLRGVRDLALEDFYLGYRQTQLAADEVLTHILIPLPIASELSRVYKVSKRFEDDISAVCIGIKISLDQEQRLIVSARIGVGGMAPVPTRAFQTEALLLGKPFTLETMIAAGEKIRTEFTPIDDMRASALYRRQVAGNLILRFWHEIQHPQRPFSLESFDAAPILFQAPKARQNTPGVTPGFAQGQRPDSSGKP
jgi:xanthine dehydrogenase small subunit